METSRRDLFRNSAYALSGLVIAFHIPKADKLWAQEAKPAAFANVPNAFIRIAPDSSVTLVINKLEMGQGVNTSMAQLIAEELECDWTKVRSESAPVDVVYNHTAFPMQMTGGSTSLSSSWDHYRTLGASMREMLVSAAATKWGVPVRECQAVNGSVVHAAKGKLSYGELAEAAAKLPLPKEPKLKSRGDFKIIGQSKTRVDAADKSNGKAIFGMDVRIPNMLYALVAHPPAAGATVKKMNDSEAKKIKGVVDVVQFGNRVAVLGKNTFAAKKGRDALQIEWNGAETALSSKSMADAHRKLADGEAPLAEERGKVEAKLKAAQKKVTQEYLLPHLAHASMEPLNVTINYDGKTCEIWSGHQMPGIDQGRAAQILGLDPKLVKINTTYAGGSFGRRASKDGDYVAVAAELAKQVKKPFKLVWSREDDMRAGYYRPMALHRVTLGFDGKKLQAWDHRIVVQSIMKGSPMEGMIKNGIEEAAVEGVSKTPYNFPDFRCTQNLAENPMTSLWWRSVGNSHTAYVMETMVDELAEHSGEDALTMRKKLLAKSPKHLAVLDLLEQTSPWKKRKSLPKGHALGLALHESFGSVVGYVTEISVEKKMPKVHNIWAAVHCGQVVNPEVAKTQIEGAVVFGLSAALYQGIVVEKGQVKTGNFDDYPVMRLDEMPKVNVAFVASTDAPTGLGEPGVPPIAPALANAYHVLTKKRILNLPFATAVLA
jgi:isoquinoline 1-oxidoreductase beta subunit